MPIQTAMTLAQSMVSFITDQPRRFRLMLRDLVGNARILVITEPCWSIPFGWFATYAVLYMQALKLTKLDIGWVTFIFVFAQIPATLVGGYIADHWGRKKSVMWFDLICWMIPLFFWLFARTKRDFIIAALINGFSWVVIPAWLCLFAEDTPPEKRTNSFGFLYIIFFFCGLFVPVGGYLVARYGIISGARMMYGIAIITIAIGLVVRWIKLKEPAKNVTTNLNQLMDPGWKTTLAEYKAAIKYGWNNPSLRILFLISCFGGLQYTIWATFQPLYLTDANGLNFSQAIISWLPAVAALTMIFIVLLVLPYVTISRIKSFLQFSYAMIVVSSILFLIAPAGIFGILILYAFISAIGLGIFSPLRDSFVMNNLKDDRYRAKVLALSGLAALLCSLPGGPLGGYLYILHPKLPFVVALLLQCIILFLFTKLKRVVEESR
jgi:DHA1 family tetracycline resistance protein-like MFS transporter